METASSWLRRGLRKKPPPPAASSASSGNGQDKDLLQYGLTDKLQEFVKGFTLDTFKNFTLPPPSDEEDESGFGSQNVRTDLTEWQERHATLVLSRVKEISRLRYMLCPRHMKEREFWRIYFALVKNYVTPYELWATQEAKLKKVEMNGKKSVDLNACEVEMVESKELKKFSRSDLGLSSSSPSNSECEGEGVAGDEAVLNDSSVEVLR